MGVRARVPPDIRKAFIDSALIDPVEAGKMSPSDLALAILQHGTPAMKKEVQVTSDPAPIKRVQEGQQAADPGMRPCHTVGKTAPGNPFALFADGTDAAYISTT